MLTGAKSSDVYISVWRKDIPSTAKVVGLFSGDDVPAVDCGDNFKALPGDIFDVY